MFYNKKPPRRYTNSELHKYLNEEERFICQFLDERDKGSYIDLAISCKPNLHEIVSELNEKRRIK